MKRRLPGDLPLRPALVLGLVSALSLGGYLLASARLYRLGFPLDDAWIHQTYARNLGLHGEWAFLPGQPSAGSTSPLWTVLLAPAHTLGLGPYLWTFLLGWLLSWFNSLTGYSFLRRFLEKAPGHERATWPALAGAVFLALEWRLAWAAGSGMETLLFAGMCLWVIDRLGRATLPQAELVYPACGWFGLGLVIGLSLWVRPDGVTLLGPALLVILLGVKRDKASSRWRWLAGARLVAGFSIPLVGYLVFNRLAAGAWWPNTYFAKQAEYAILRQLPFWQRLLQQLQLPLVGAGALLLPGFFYLGWRAWQARCWAALGALAWMLGFLGLYAWRLPVTYQYGRYAIPAMNIYFALGLAGMLQWMWNKPALRWKRVLDRAWVLSLALLVFIFWGRGAGEYALGVAVIESEMVETAHWIDQNTSDQALVAAHDIGALGYFGQRRLIDLAGLVTPDVIPFIRSEPQLAAYLEAQGADYLVTFPGWYPELVRGKVVLYASNAPFSPKMGGEHLSVFRWEAP